VKRKAVRGLEDVKRECRGERIGMEEEERMDE